MIDSPRTQVALRIAAVLMVTSGWLSLSVGLTPVEAQTGPSDSTPSPERVLEVLDYYCGECHDGGRGASAGRFDTILDLPALVSDPDYVVPGEPDQSELYLRIEFDEMPPDDYHTGPVPEAVEQELARWIAAGAPTEVVAPLPETPVEIPAVELALEGELPPTDAEPTEPVTEAGSTPVEVEADTDRESEPEFDTVTFQDRLGDWLGRLHPAAVHFPIAMLLGALLAEVLHALFPRLSMGTVVRFCLWVGLFGAVVATGLGWLNAAYHGPVGPTRAKVIEWHRWTGVLATVCAVAGVVCVELRAWKPDAAWSTKGLRIVLVLIAVTISLAGFFGASIVHGGLDHLAW